MVKCYFREVFYQVLCRSPVVLPLKSFGIDLTLRKSTRLMLVTPFMPDGTVADYIHSHPKISALAKSRIAFSMIAPICFLHRLRIHHRDIKMGNYVIGPETPDVPFSDIPDVTPARNVPDEKVCAFLIDLGLSRSRVGGSLVNTKGPRTPGYDAPEITSEEFGFPADVYAWGKCLWGLLDGRSKITDGPPVSRQTAEYGPLKDLMKRCTDNDPDRRPTAEWIFEQFEKGAYRFPWMKPDDDENFNGFVKSISIRLRRREEEIKMQNSPCPMFGALGDLERLLGPNSFEFARTVRESARKGMNEASVLMGVIYHRGLGLDRDDARALKWLAAVGTEEANRLADEIRSEASDYMRGCVFEAEGKLEEAAGSYWNGAMGRCRECVAQLGRMLLRLGDERAERILLIARKMGDRTAAYALAKHYRGDPEKADAELRMAAEWGHCGARARLAGWVKEPK
jgi:hypothetical protein